MIELPAGSGPAKMQLGVRCDIERRSCPGPVGGAAVAQLVAAPPEEGTGRYPGFAGRCANVEHRSREENRMARILSGLRISFRRGEPRADAQAGWIVGRVLG